MGERPLTKEEKEYLISWLDKPNLFIGPFPLENERRRHYWKSLALRDLNMQHVGPRFKRAQLMQLKEWMERDFLKNRTPYGHPVGKEAGTSIGEHTSQITLKLKGNTGTSASSKVVNMSQHLEKILSASKTSIEFIIVRFKKQWNFQDLYFNRLLFYSVSMKTGKFIKRVEYMNQNEIVEPDWYQLYSEIYDVELPENKRFIRIEFNTVNLYSFRLTLQEIVDKIKDSEVGEYILVIPSPQHLGIIDIFPADNYKHDMGSFQQLLLGKSVIFTAEKKKGKKKKTFEDEDEEDDEQYEEVTETTNIFDDDEDDIEVEVETEQSTEEVQEDEVERNAQDIYLKTKVKPILDNLIFGNNNGVLSLSVNWDNLVVVIGKEKVIGERKYDITFDRRVIREKSIQINNFYNFFTKKGWTIEKTQAGCILQHASMNKTPTQSLREATDSAIDFDNAVQPYLQLEGYLEDVITLPGIDLTTIKTDSAVSTKKFFGIESARKLLYQQIKEIFNVIYPAHIMLLADFMTVTGDVLGLTRNGVGKGNGPLTKSSFEQQKDAFISGAARPIEEPVTVSTSVFLGTTAALGTGVVEVYKDESFQPPAKKEVVESREIETLRALLEKTELSVTEPAEQGPLLISPEPSILGVAKPNEKIPPKKWSVRRPLISGTAQISQKSVKRSNLAPQFIGFNLPLPVYDSDGDQVESAPPPIEATPVVKITNDETIEKDMDVEIPPAPSIVEKPKAKKIVKKIVTKKVT